MCENAQSYVELRPQDGVGDLETASVSGVSIRGGLSPAFDIPVELVVDRFKEELVSRAADKTWDNDYDGFDVFHLKATQAIQEVVDHDNPRVSRCSAPSIIKENIGPQAEQHYDDWEVLAESWISQWFMLYNSILETNLGEEVEELETALHNVYSHELLEAEDVQMLTEHLLDRVVSE